MRIHFIGNSFVHRHSRNNSIPHCLSLLGDFEIKETINEGHGFCSYWSNAKIRNKIISDCKSFKPDYIVLEGGIPNSSWHVAGLKMIREIQKVSKGNIIILCHHHVGQDNGTTIKRCNALASACGGYALPVNKYYSSLNIKTVDSDHRHPTFECYYIASVSLYCYLTKKKPSTKETYKTVSYDMRKKIVETVSNDYGIKTEQKTTTNTVLEVPKPTIKRGSKGTNVKRLQKALNHFGANLKVDGSAGSITIGSLKSWQNRNKLKPDGIYGSKSYSIMKKLIVK